LKTAFQLGLIAYEDDWLRMLDDRNLAVHASNAKYAEDIYGRLTTYAGMLMALSVELNKNRTE
jgi:hypothetical protein